MLDVFSQPDREKRIEHRILDLHEARKELRPRPFEDKQIDIVTREDGIFTATEVGHATRHMSPKALLARQRREAVATAMAAVRQEQCCMPDCSGRAASHVAIIDFDMKDGAHDGDAIVSTMDNPYPGPVPGFCLLCATSGPKALAQAVYESKPQMLWGLKPKRWWVTFTDGSKVGGPCADIDRILAPIVTEIYEPA